MMASKARNQLAPKAEIRRQLSASTPHMIARTLS